MTAILTVDDSRPIRTIVGKQVRELGFEVLEAEDGLQGLEQLAKGPVDLVLLDVTMPNLDGPGMLQRMREGGDKTPVIMLTSEAKRSVVAGAMKLGIADYILKPFKPEELRQKVLAVLQGEPGAPLPDAPAPGGEAGGDPLSANPAGRFVDVLVVDDMENVPKKLRALLPGHIGMNGFTNAQTALGACRERVYRVVLIDTEIPDVNSAVLAQQLRVLQPHAAVVALALRTANDATKEVKDLGFDDVLFKPFRPESIDDFLLRYFDNQELVQVDDNLVRVAPFSGRADKVDRFYGRLQALFPEALEKIAAACHDDVVLDVGSPPLEGDRLPKLVHAVSQRSRDFGMTLAVVGPAPVRDVLAGYTETKDLRFFGSVQEARAAAGA